MSASGLLRKDYAALFSFIGIYEPLGIYPAPVIPIFTNGADTERIGELFASERTETGLVSRFVAFRSPRQNPIRLVGADLVRAVGDQCVYSYALESDAYRVFGAVEEFSGFLLDLLHGDFFVARPLAGLEAARFVADSNAEERFAELSVRWIARSSLRSAQDWVSHGSLNPRPRQMAQAALNELRVGATPSTVVVPRRAKVWITENCRKEFRTKLFGLSIRVVVEKLREWFDEGLRNVPDVLLLNSEDLFELLFDYYAEEGLRGAIRMGLVTILVRDGELEPGVFGRIQKLIHHRINVSDDVPLAPQLRAVVNLLGLELPSVQPEHSVRQSASQSIHRRRK